MRLYFSPIFLKKFVNIDATIAGIAGSYGENWQRKYSQIFSKRLD